MDTNDATAVATIASARSGVVQINCQKDKSIISSGSGFLVPGGIITNSHVLRPDSTVDMYTFRFADTDQDDTASYIPLRADECDARIKVESPVDGSDYAFIELNGPDFASRHCFEFGDISDIRVGEQVVFLGFPFGMPQLTAHVGWVASIHTQGSVPIIQIDGSVNGANSGGPLIDPKSGRVVGIVTRATTGIEQDFDQLILALKKNQEVLANRTGIGLAIQGVDHIKALQASQAIMEKLAVNLKRSANVGIGYAYSTNELRDRLASPDEPKPDPPDDES